VPAEFGQIFDRHFGAIYGFVWRRLGAGLAEEVSAETFFTAFDRRADFDLSFRSARPWLFGIATNLIRGERRSQARQLRAYALSVEREADAGMDTAEERADAERLRPRLAAEIASLPLAEAEPLLLYAWAELSYEEIAVSLALPLGTVKSRIARARSRIRQALQLDQEPLLRTPTAGLEAENG
jgi:RNA polymerase sigma factor (sigma-70 family)